MAFPFPVSIPLSGLNSLNNPWLKALGIFLLSGGALFGCEKTDPDVIAGESIVNQNCKVCHAPGLNNAPVLGNKVMWKPRAEQGLETLVEHASNGYGLMPAKGGNEALTEIEITQGIKYMLSLLETE